MEKEESFRPITPESLPTGASDMTMALFLMQHIDSPCEVQVGPDEFRTIRQFYITEAERVMKTMENETAREMLGELLASYTSK